MLIRVRKPLFEKEYIWNLATCSFESCKYLANIFDRSVIMCYEIIEEKKLFQRILMEKK